jgi:hypothetical protein
MAKIRKKKKKGARGGGSSGDEWLFHTTHFITLDQPLFLLESMALCP